MKLLNRIMIIIDDKIEENRRDLEYMRENGISMNSCGAGFAQGALDELLALKDEILEMSE